MSEITEHTGTAPTPQPQPQQAMPSFWEDVIEIFVHPVDVFRRRANDSFWPPLLFVAVAIGLIVFATFNVLTPVFEAEFTRSTAKTIADNPQAAAAVEGMRDTMLKVSRFTVPVFIVIGIFVLGLVAWLLSKMFDAKTTAGQGILIAAWSYMPRVLGTIAGSTQALLMDPSKLNAQLAISLSPARFLDPDTANPLVYQMLGRLDVTIIWETILLAIGVYVTGKISHTQAIVFAIVNWLLGAVPMIRNAVAQM
jgi:hypothetical protein